MRMTEYLDKLDKIEMLKTKVMEYEIVYNNRMDKIGDGPATSLELKSMCDLAAEGANLRQLIIELYEEIIERGGVK